MKILRSKLDEKDAISVDELEKELEDEIDIEDLKVEEPISIDDSGDSMLLNSLIRSEWEAVDEYTSAIATLSDAPSEVREKIIRILTDIQDEEMVHIGQLQLALGLLVPNVDNIEAGTKEGEEQVEETPEEIKDEEELDVE